MLKVRTTDQPVDLRFERRIEERVRTGTCCRVAEQRRRDVALLIEVEHEAALGAFLAHPSDQPAEVCLADAALEVERGDDRGRSLRRGRHAHSLPRFNVRRQSEATEPATHGTLISRQNGLLQPKSRRVSRGNFRLTNEVFAVRRAFGSER